MALASKLQVLIQGCGFISIVLLAEALSAMKLNRMAASLIERRLQEPGKFADELRTHLAYICGRMGNFDKAGELLHDAILRDPKNAYAYVELGMLNEDTGCFDVARENFQRALALGSDFGQDFRNELQSRIIRYGGSHE